MAKSKEEVLKFIDALEDAGYEPKSYSGRGMFGRNCVSVSGSGRDGDMETPSAWDIAKALSDESYDGEFDTVPEPRQDQLGLGIVLYWPAYEWPEETA